MARIDELLRLNQQGASSAPLPTWLNPNSPGIPTAPDPLGIGRPAGAGGPPRSEAPQDPREQLAMLLAQGPEAQAGGMDLTSGTNAPGAPVGGLMPPNSTQPQGPISDLELELLRNQGRLPPGMNIPGYGGRR